MRRPETALAELYTAKYGRFLHVALAVAGDVAAAHDAVQDGFARALQKVETFRGSGSLESWVWTIVLNEARAARARVLPVVDPVDIVAPNGSAKQPELRALIARLPERQRLVVFLRYFADLDYRSIADALGIEVGTVSATLNAAHATLRRSLEEVLQCP